MSEQTLLNGIHVIVADISIRTGHLRVSVVQSGGEATIRDSPARGGFGHASATLANAMRRQ